MMPIIIAAITWGDNWKGGQVVVHCDNTAVVTALNDRSYKNTFVIQMLRALSFVKSAISLKWSLNTLQVVVITELIICL